MNAREKRVEKAQMRILFQTPFFAPGVCKLPVVFDDTGAVDTACTNGDQIIWGTKFFDSLSDQEIVTVLCHEVAHCLLGHIWRAPTDCQWDRWNKATDHAVNNMLTEFGETVKAKNLADPFPFPKGQWCNDPAYRNMSEETIYSKLPQSPPQGGQGGKPGKGGKAGNGPVSIGQIAPGKGNSAQQKQQKTAWENALHQGMQAMKGRGDIPGSIARYADQLLNPQVNWWDLVNQWLRERAEDDYNWLKPNPYFDESGFILPSLDSERIGPIVFATDTSGSIDADMLNRFQTEKQNCLDDMRPSRLLDIGCDTSIQWIAEYQPGERIDRKCKGGGGTSFVPVFDHAATLPELPRCLVYLTDLDGTFPDKDPGYPILWVVYGGRTSVAPFGETIHVKPV